MKVGTRIWIVALLVGLIGAVALALTIPALQGVQHRYEALLQRDVELRVNNARLRAEIYQRAAARNAYLLTGNPADNEAFRDARRRWERLLVFQRRLLGDRPALLERLSEIEEQADELDRTVGAGMLQLTARHQREGTSLLPEGAALAREGGVQVERIRLRIEAFDRAVREDLVTQHQAVREYAERAGARLGAALTAVLITAVLAALSLWNGVRVPLLELTASARRIAVGQHVRLGWIRRDELGELGRSLETMSEALDQRARELQQHSAVVALDAQLGAVLNQAPDVRATAEGGLRLIADALGAYAGALFVAEGPDSRFVAEAVRGPVRSTLVREGFVAGEGVLGQVARDGGSLFLQPPPADTPRFETATANHAAAAYLLRPVRRGDTVIAVLELACAAMPDENLLGHLDAFVDQLGIALANALAARDRDRLLSAVEAQYAEVRTREERLRTQSDTLDAQARELARKNEELQVANQLKSQFIATLSHELRTPLNSILGFTELLLTRSRTLGADDRRTLEEVRAAGRHLLGLINDILDLARIGAGRLGLRRSAVPVASIAAEVLQVLRPQAQGKHLTLQSTVAPEVAVDADPSRLRQILLNLVGNAVKFTEVGSVTVGARPVGERVRVEVADTGPGIDVTDRARLFREFSQLEKSGRRHEGSGLGLAIARELVLAHGGEIGVDSEPGKGSVFWFELPPARLPSSAPPPPAPALPPAAPTPALSPAPPASEPASEPLPEPASPASVPTGAPRRVLLVEDHPRNARLIQAMLSPEQYAVEHVSEGLPALERALAEPPAVVLLDLELPDLDGFEVARRLRSDARTAQVPIIAVTARALPTDEARARAIGCNEFVTKPVDTATLHRALEAVLARPGAG